MRIKTRFILISGMMLYNTLVHSQDTTRQTKIFKSSNHKTTNTISKTDTVWWNRSTSNGSALLSALISSAVIFYFGRKTYKQWQQDQLWKKKDASWKRREEVFKRIDSL